MQLPFVTWSVFYGFVSKYVSKDNMWFDFWLSRSCNSIVTPEGMPVCEFAVSFYVVPAPPFAVLPTYTTWTAAILKVLAKTLANI